MVAIVADAYLGAALYKEMLLQCHWTEGARTMLQQFRGRLDCKYEYTMKHFGGAQTFQITF